MSAACCGREPAGRGEGAPPGLEGGTGAGKEELEPGRGDRKGRSAGPAAEGSGAAAGLRGVSRCRSPTPSLCPRAHGPCLGRRRRGDLARPGPAGTRMRGAAGRTMQLHVSLAARFKEKRAGCCGERAGAAPPLAHVSPSPPDPLPSGFLQPG